MKKDDINRYFLVTSLSFAFTILFFFTLPPVVSCKTNDYYYLQIGSFREKQNAIRLTDQIETIEKNTVVRKKNVPTFGYLYQFLVGPYSSRKEADQRKRMFQEKHIFVEDAFVINTSVPILPNLKEKEVSRSDFLKSADTATINNDISVKIIETNDEVLSKKETIPTTETEKPAEIDDHKVIQKEPALLMTETDHSEDKSPEPKSYKTTTKKRERGRNINKGEFALSYHHFFNEYETKIDKRNLITSNGTTITTTGVAVGGLQNENFDTTMHWDTLRIHYGITDYLEVFTDVGILYRETSKGHPIYGGGGRLNLFEIDSGRGNTYYGAMQGDFSYGKLKTEYGGNSGYRWDKEADWRALTARVELGTVFDRFSLFAGGSYGLYSEETTRTLLSNLPATVISYKYEDELSEKSSFNAFGGFDYRISNRLRATVEGQVGSFNYVSGSLKYQFK
jgi:hypothetical protein